MKFLFICFVKIKKKERKNERTILLSFSLVVQEYSLLYEDLNGQRMKKVFFFTQIFDLFSCLYVIKIRLKLFNFMEACIQLLGSSSIESVAFYSTRVTNKKKKMKQQHGRWLFAMFFRLLRWKWKLSLLRDTLR